MTGIFNLRLIFLLTALASAALLGACDMKNGGHGENCEARNDCRRGFACVNWVCVKDDFPISIESGKDCVLIDCETTADCCGDRPTSTPAKCAERERFCTPLVDSCTQNMYCTGEAQCGEGTCVGSGACSNNGNVCMTNEDCAGVCDITLGQCAGTSAPCGEDADCSGGVCAGFAGTCNCTNPEYDPSHAICNDRDCDEVCDLVCNSARRCVAETLCEDDSDCPGSQHCDSVGHCVQCLEDSHCSDDERCTLGRCEAPCTKNEHCGIFEACESGDCVYVGCQTDRECVLFGSTAADRDGREARCISIAGSDIKQCHIPCDSDRECGQTERCNQGVCTYIGCESDQECRAHFGAGHQPKDRAYTSEAFCIDIE